MGMLEVPGTLKAQNITMDADVTERPDLLIISFTLLWEMFAVAALVVILIEPEFV